MLGKCLCAYPMQTAACDCGGCDELDRGPREARREAPRAEHDRIPPYSIQSPSINGVHCSPRSWNLRVQLQVAVGGEDPISALCSGDDARLWLRPRDGYLVRYYHSTLTYYLPT